jgi:beta-glucosidase
MPLRLAVVMLALVPGLAAQAPPYRNSSLPAVARVRDLLGRMSLEEKFWQLYMSPGSLDDSTHDYSHGAFGLQIGVDSASAALGSPSAIARAHAQRINTIQRYFVEETRLGIPIIAFDEALHGLMREGATIFPQAIGLAATWDTALMRRVAEAIARETGERGIRHILSPVVNLGNDARWGRMEETYGEDPFLSSQMGVAFVQAFEQRGILATPKHFVANVGAGGRDSYPVDLSARYLEEYHFPPFRAAVQDAGARSVMTAYNSVDGRPATQQPWLLNQVLKKEWGFTGFVISDAAATGGATVLHMTEPSTPVAAEHAWEAGLDVVFQSTWEQHRPYRQALMDGLVDLAIIDSAVARVLRAKFELGLFERPYVNLDSAAHWSASNPALAREAAAASVVLLHNDGLLPFAPSVRRIAVLGVDATEARPGGYSGAPRLRQTILQGIEAWASGEGREVHFAPGPGRYEGGAAVVPAAFLSQGEGDTRVAGLRGEYFTDITPVGTPALVRTDTRLDFAWTLSGPARGIRRDWYSARWTGELVAPAAGVKRLGIRGKDGYRLWLDGDLLIDTWRKQSAGARLVDVNLVPNRRHGLRVEFYETTGNGRIALVWDTLAVPAHVPAIDSAVAVAQGADVAIVVAGIEEGEFRDRASLRLPGHQEAMIRAVAAIGTPVVMVLIGGGPVTMADWLDEVGAVLVAWYPGDEGGGAMADILSGAVNPGGRLPMTWPVSEGQLPLTYNHKPTGRGDDYLDLTGEPLFPFGHGLSYTTFAYDNLRISADMVSASDTVTVTVRVTNTGSRIGDEVVQVHVRDVLATVARPVMELKGFQRVHLRPGTSTDVTIQLPVAEWRFLDAAMNWVVEPGEWQVMVGSSSREIRLRGRVVVGGG